MTGDLHKPRCDWLQQARIEISSNTIIFHDETFVKMVTVEDILNRLSEERQRCYWAHSDAETEHQEQKITTSCIHCISCGKQISSYHQLIFRGIAFCPECIEQEKDIEPRHRTTIAQAAREKVLGELGNWLNKEMEENEADIAADDMETGRFNGYYECFEKVKSLRSPKMDTPVELEKGNDPK